MGLRLRVILILTIPALLVIGFHGFLRVQQEDAQLVREDEENLALTGRAVQIAVENALRDRQTPDIHRLLVQMVEQQDAIDRIRLFDRDAKPVLVSNVLAIDETVPASELHRVMDTATAETFVQRAKPARGRPSLLFYLAPLRGRDGRVEGSMEIVKLAAAADRRFQTAVLDVFVRLSALLLVLVVVTLVALQVQVLRPLARLTAGIHRLGHGEAGPPLPVDRHDELGRVAEAFNDMSRRLAAETDRAAEMEHELRRAATLAVAGKLTSALAHEVGTPLNIISGRAELVLKQLAPGDPARADVETIMGQIDRISGIINSLLDTVRPQRPELSPVSVAAVLEPLLPLLRHTARARGIALDGTNGQPGHAHLPPILADAGQFQQVLINLTLNALDATSADGRVDIKTGAAARDGRPGVEVSVEDTGTGIPADIAARIFDPFFTTKPRRQGTGLGLSICRDIVKAHGGTIAVASEVGRGTTFTVWMPAAEVQTS
jgi:signal transduction histidine kinase